MIKEDRTYATEEIISGQEFLSGGGEMAILIRNKDWSQTSFGDIKYWPSSLKTMVSVCLNVRFPALILWGPQMNIIYNDAYAGIIGSKHPSVLGEPAREAWSDTWDRLSTVIESVYKEGKATLFENQLRLLNRNGLVEEGYFTFSQTPIYVESGKIGGVFTVVNETSRIIINDRRQRTLNELVKEIGACETNDEIYTRALKVLGKNNLDIPFSIIYKIDSEGTTATSVGSVGISLPFKSISVQIDLYSNSITAKNLLKCVEAGELVRINDLKMQYGDLPSGAWHISPNEGLNVPICHVGRKIPYAILSVGINPHLRFDSKFNLYFQSIRILIENAIANLVSVEQEKLITEARILAEKQLNNLFIQAPFGIAVLKGPNLIAELVNDAMLAILGRTSKDEVLNKPIFEAIPEGTGQGFEQIFNEVYQTGKRFRSEEAPVKLLRNGKEEIIYVKYIFEALRDEAGVIIGMMSIAHDITDLVQARKKLEDNEEYLKIAIDTAELGTYSWESPQTELVFSDRTAQIYGYEGSKNLTQAHLQKSVHPKDLKVLEDAYEKSKKDGNLQYECRLIWPDGSLHWISVRSKVFFTDQKAPIKLYGTAMDITGQMRFAENLKNLVESRTRSLEEKNEEIKRSEERYQKITEEVEDYAIILLSPEGIILNWNKGAEKIKGYTEPEIVGQHFSIFYTLEDRRNKLPEKLIKEAEQEGRSIYEGPRVKKNGYIYWGSTVITALHNENKEIIGFSKITRDLTERKESEDKLKQYTTELEFQNKELEQFAYVASHDLQEPLRIIRMYSQLLEKTIKNKEGLELYFQKIQNSANRMQELIKSVLNYSRLTSMDDEFIKIDLNSILEDVKSDFEVLINDKQAIIKSDHLPQINGVPLQIHQLFSNLISNSLKFSNEKPLIQVKFKIIPKNEMQYLPFLNKQNQYVLLQFIDNGIGFEQEYAERIFDVFQRLHEKQVYDGTGVGLALCKKIVTNHHGFIEAISSPGDGSTFNVYLPLNNIQI